MIRTFRHLPLALVGVSTLAIAAPPDGEAQRKAFRERADHARKVDGDPGYSPQGKAWAWMRVVTSANDETKDLKPSKGEARQRLDRWQDAIGEEHAMWRAWFDITQKLDDDLLARVSAFLGAWEDLAPKSTAVVEARAVQKAAKAGRDAKRALEDARKGKLRGFARISPGAFTMGSPRTEALRFDDEIEHEVQLHWPFWLSETEVTQREWSEQTGTNPSYFKAAGLDAPVDSVSYEEAAYFMNQMSRRAGLEECYGLSDCKGTVGGGCKDKTLDGAGTCESDYTCLIVRSAGTACGGYRLPTEAEWEYAARAGTTTPTFTNVAGQTDPIVFPALEPYAWFAVNSAVTYRSEWKCNKQGPLAGQWCGPQPVGKKQPNAWGLYDMLGNAFELVSDYALHDNTYLLRQDRGPEVNPTGPAQNGNGNMVRGGSWLTGAREARAAYHLPLKRERRHVLVGFRVARTIR